MLITDHLIDIDNEDILDRICMRNNSPSQMNITLQNFSIVTNFISQLAKFFNYFWQIFVLKNLFSKT